MKDGGSGTVARLEEAGQRHADPNGEDHRKVPRLGQLVELTDDSMTIMDFPALGFGERLQDRLGEHLRLALAKLINADPQLLGVVLRVGVQWKRKGRCRVRSVVSSKLTSRRSGRCDIRPHSVRSSEVGERRRS